MSLLYALAGFTMIIGLTCWEFIVVMTVIVVLLMVPVVYWAIRRKLNQRKGKSQPVPPLMYITTVSSSRTSDVDIPVCMITLKRAIVSIISSIDPVLVFVWHLTF